MKAFAIYRNCVTNNHWNGDHEYHDEVAELHQYYRTEQEAQQVCDAHNEELKVQHRKAHDDKEAERIAAREKEIRTNEILARNDLARPRNIPPYKPSKYIEPYNWRLVDGYWSPREVEIKGLD